MSKSAVEALGHDPHASSVTVLEVNDGNSEAQWASNLKMADSEWAVTASRQCSVMPAGFCETMVKVTKL